MLPLDLHGPFQVILGVLQCWDLTPQAQDILLLVSYGLQTGLVHWVSWMLGEKFSKKLKNKQTKTQLKNNF